MAHPIYLVRRFMEKVENGHYRAIGKTAAAKYQYELSEVDPYERLAQVFATKVRLADKLALINALIAWAIGSTDTISDEEALAVLVGWATVEGKRWGSPVDFEATLEATLADLASAAEAEERAG